MVLTGIVIPAACSKNAPMNVPPLPAVARVDVALVLKSLFAKSTSSAEVKPVNAPVLSSEALNVMVVHRGIVIASVIECENV